jgi:pyruvyltransferase
MARGLFMVGVTNFMVFICILLAFTNALYSKQNNPLQNLTTKVSFQEGLPLYYWKDRVPRIDTMDGQTFVNFGDFLSLKIVERIVGGPIRVYVKKKQPERKLLALGSIFYFAVENDVIWGSGINGKTLQKSDYKFTSLDVRAVRGPLTRQFLWEHFKIDCPEIYGDPALLLPYLFPEFQRKKNPTYEFVVIPHFADAYLFLNGKYDNVIFPWDPWEQIIDKILDSKLVISSTLHGIVVAEAFGIPARLLRISNNQHIFKYKDYYAGTNRPNFQFATSIEQALSIGGEVPFECDLEKLYNAFPFEFWPTTVFTKPSFNKIWDSHE